MANPADRYEAAWALTRRMQEAALALEWETLMELEAQRAPLLAAPPPTAAAAGRRVAELIRDILEVDAEIRERVESWRTATATLLGRLAPRP